jgi:hypothetical protein
MVCVELKRTAFKEETEVANGKVGSEEFAIKSGVFLLGGSTAPACESEASVATAMAVAGSGN